MQAHNKSVTPDILVCALALSAVGVIFTLESISSSEGGPKALLNTNPLELLDPHAIHAERRLDPNNFILSDAYKSLVTQALVNIHNELLAIVEDTGPYGRQSFTVSNKLFDTANSKIQQNLLVSERLLSSPPMLKSSPNLVIQFYSLAASCRHLTQVHKDEANRPMAVPYPAPEGVSVRTHSAAALALVEADAILRELVK